MSKQVYKSITRDRVQRTYARFSDNRRGSRREVLDLLIDLEYLMEDPTGLYAVLGRFRAAIEAYDRAIDSPVSQETFDWAFDELQEAEDAFMEATSRLDLPRPPESGPLRDSVSRDQ